MAIGYHDSMMTPKFFRLLAWSALAVIVFVTTSPIGLRPHDVLAVNVDRALAFTITTMLFVLAYPRHWLLCAALLVVGAFGIEMLQLLSPTRHAHLQDAGIKAAGAAIGVALGLAINEFRVRRQV